MNRRFYVCTYNHDYRIGYNLFRWDGKGRGLTYLVIDRVGGTDQLQPPSLRGFHDRARQTNKWKFLGSGRISDLCVQDSSPRISDMISTQPMGDCEYPKGARCRSSQGLCRIHTAGRKLLGLGSTDAVEFDTMC